VERNADREAFGRPDRGDAVEDGLKAKHPGDHHGALARREEDAVAYQGRRSPYPQSAGSFVDENELAAAISLGGGLAGIGAALLPCGRWTSGIFAGILILFLALYAVAKRMRGLARLRGKPLELPT
jgi:hypothetical protein